MYTCSTRKRKWWNVSNALRRNVNEEYHIPKATDVKFQKLNIQNLALIHMYCDVLCVRIEIIARQFNLNC